MKWRETDRRETGEEGKFNKAYGKKGSRFTEWPVEDARMKLIEKKKR